MQSQALFNTVRIVSTVILALMLAAIGYAGAIGIAYWSGIGV